MTDLPGLIKKAQSGSLTGATVFSIGCLLAIRIMTSVGEEKSMADEPGSHARIEQQLNLLHHDLAQLEERCADVSPPTDVTSALRQFKELGPLFETVDSFIAVAASSARKLESRKAEQVEAQLHQLHIALWHLRLGSVEPVLQRLAQDVGKMPLGTRFVMQRWLGRLTDLRGQADVADALPAGMLDRIEQMTRLLVEQATDLTEFN
jgi:hypothetical protein